MNKVSHISRLSDFEDCGPYIENTGKFCVSQCKRLKNIYWLLYTSENICKAALDAQKGKGNRSDIRRFNKDVCANLDAIYFMLADETYNPGKYRVKVIHDPKERQIMIAPFFPDRIIHHCLINVMGQHWTHLFVENTYACIKGRGTHKCMEDVKRALRQDKKGTRYCLKTDLAKYYDHIDHGVLKAVLRRTIADAQLLRLLDKIVDSNGKSVGLPIGNYTSQYFANLYLTYYDHWVNEVLACEVKRKFGVKLYYFRYMDDMVFLAASKDALQFTLDAAGLYLASQLRVEFKHNWQIFPVESRGIDFVGFLLNHGNVMLRKSILLKFYRKAAAASKNTKISNENDIMHLFASEYGWTVHCDKAHQNKIFKRIIENGQKHFNNRPVVGDTPAGDRPAQQRAGNVPVQPQHRGSGRSGRGRQRAPRNRKGR